MTPMNMKTCGLEPFFIFFDRHGGSSLLVMRLDEKGEGDSPYGGPRICQRAVLVKNKLRVTGNYGKALKTRYFT